MAAAQSPVNAAGHSSTWSNDDPRLAPFIDQSSFNSGAAASSLNNSGLTGYQKVADALSADLYSCACGCGIFDVGTATMLPHGQGGTVWEEFDYIDQTHNRHGFNSAPGDQNGDKEVKSMFYRTGLQYFFNRSWGFEAEVPIVHRSFASEDGTANWGSLGDVSLQGIYTGFSEDQSIGVKFGMKFPTGNFIEPVADRDTQIGSGSTDILLGAFFRHNLNANWTLFTQANGDIPIFIQDHYRPGIEANVAGGVYYEGLKSGDFRFTPIAQVIGSFRTNDSGTNSAHPIATGYERLILSPGLEISYHQWSLYGDAEFPVYQYFRGNQLVSPVMFKFILSYSF